MMAGRGTTRTDAAGGPARHIPVLLTETLDVLNPRDGGIYVDGTFGAGGYSKAIIEAADCIVIAIDRDPRAIRAGQALVGRFPDRLKMFEGRFGSMDDIAAKQGIEAVDGVALDLGLSSMQLDEADRGFSFQSDGPLDMRMSGKGPSAADVVNELNEHDLAQAIAVLGEERRARAIARAVVDRRKERPIQRTGELADLVIRVLGRRPGASKHPATRTFQALRLFVNGELEELARGLLAAERLLLEGGRLVVVTFHSLEDRIAKRFFTQCAKPPHRPSRHRPDDNGAKFPPSFRLVNRRPLGPKPQEVAYNPRARSARLRAGERTGAPPLAPDISSLGLPNLAALES